MNVKITLTLLVFLFSQQLFANKLVTVQAISKSRRSFVTRLGRKDGVYPGTKGTFTGNNVSVIAKASTVTREFTQWTIDNEFANVPFEKDEIITYHNTGEYIWTLMPEEVRRKFLKEISAQYKSSISLRTSLSTGIKESTSGVDNQSTKRGGLVAEVIYEKEYTRNLTFAMGGRFESETINVESSSLSTSRVLVLGEATYYMNEMENFYNGRVYIGLSLGYGSTTTESSGSTQSGQAWLIPGVRMGIMLPINNEYKFMFEGALETLSSEEGSTEADVQTTDATNLRYGIGLRRFF